MSAMNTTALYLAALGKKDVNTCKPRAHKCLTIYNSLYFKISGHFSSRQAQQRFVFSHIKFKMEIIKKWLNSILTYGTGPDSRLLC